MKKNFLKKLFFIFFISIFSFSLYGIINRENNLKENQKEIKELKKMLQTESNSINSNTYNKDTMLKKQNQDFVFWINILNTNIDYPVLQSNDNKKYLNTSFNKNKSISGSIFMDYRCDFKNSPNLVVYGHNMKNGTMFNNLKKYSDEAFFNKNKFITIEKENKIYSYEVFSTYVTSTKFNYIKSNFKNENEYISFLQEIKNKSEIKSNITLNSKDKILTLSTCSYEFSNARRVVHAKLIEINDNIIK